MNWSGRIKNIFIPCLCALFVWNGCVQYKRPMLMIKVPDFYEHRTKLGLLSLVADPYFKSSKSEYLFNSNLLDKGILPIHFIAFNYGDLTYDLQAARFVLKRDDGAEYQPMKPDDVAKKALKHTSLRMIGWGFAGLIILSIPFSIGAGIDSFRANRKTREAIRQEELRVFEIGPREVVDGFYFFSLGKNRKEADAVLRHKFRFQIQGLVDAKTNQSYEFQIGLN